MPFLRSREGGFADSLRRSSRSAAGVYDSVNTSVNVRSRGEDPEMSRSMDEQVSPREDVK